MIPLGVVGRLREDEIAAVLPGVDQLTAVAIGHRPATVLADEVEVERRTVRVSAASGWPWPSRDHLRRGPLGGRLGHVHRERARPRHPARRRDRGAVGVGRISNRRVGLGAPDGRSVTAGHGGVNSPRPR